MESILAFIQTYVSSYWPITVFVLLILAGFNLPISEDVVIILSTIMVHQDPSSMVPTYIALYTGIFLSDLIVFTIGTLLSKGFLQFKFFKRMLSPERMNWVSKKLEKHGFATFIICRFIPFGVRNALFLSCGFARLSYLKFILFDSIASLISSSTLFFTVYYLGEVAQNSIKIVGFVLFGLLVAAAIAFFIFKRYQKKNAAKSESQEIEETGKNL